MRAPDPDRRYGGAGFASSFFHSDDILPPDLESKRERERERENESERERERERERAREREREERREWERE